LKTVLLESKFIVLLIPKGQGEFPVAEDLDYLVWQIENEKILKEGGLSDRRLSTLPYQKVAWHRPRAVRISSIPRALVLGAMQASPAVDGVYPIPKSAGVVARKLFATLSKITKDQVMKESTLFLWKKLEGWVKEIPEFIDWGDEEKNSETLDLASVLYNSGCNIECETGWADRQRFLSDIDEFQDWQQIKLVHVALIPQALVMGTMLVTTVRDVKSGIVCGWPLPPYTSKVVNWLNWTVKEKLSSKYLSPEVLSVSPFFLMESMKKWLADNPYYCVWAKMGKQSLDLDALLLRSIRWLNIEVNALMASLVSKGKEKSPDPDENEEGWEGRGEDDLLELLHI
jgi:hypothetical protein